MMEVNELVTRGRRNWCRVCRHTVVVVIREIAKVNHVSRIKVIASSSALECPPIVPDFGR